MTLGLLVGRFGTFVRENYQPPARTELPEPAFPEDLLHLREHVSHHLIPLVLLARSDGDFADSERDVIVRHCLAIARQEGLEISVSETAAFSDYVETFHPSLLQLDPALHRLEKGDHGELRALLDAAQAVVLADGIVRPEESRLLKELQDDLSSLANAN